MRYVNGAPKRIYAIISAIDGYPYGNWTNRALRDAVYRDEHHSNGIKATYALVVPKKRKR